jgi:hypothetical protein
MMKRVFQLTAVVVLAGYAIIWFMWIQGYLSDRAASIFFAAVTALMITIALSSKNILSR